MKDFKKLFEDKRILVTGGTGSIGSEIARQLLKCNPKQVRILSRDEFMQFNLQNEFNNKSENEKVSFLIGDIRDKDRVLLAMEGIDICFHAAALKHVPYCEHNPFEAVKTNVIGTQNVVEAARIYNIENLIGISTDKAASPVNTLGATKLLSEKLIMSAEEYKGNRQTKFTSVRFGNVIGSRGSVIPLFIEQILTNKKITITDNDMTRFFISIPQAVNLVFKAIQKTNGGELFILKMPVANLLDIAEVLIEILSKKFNFSPKDIKIVTIGSRRGEKTYELLLSEEESYNVYENDEMFCLKTNELTKIPEGFKKAKIKSYKSIDFEKMTKNSLIDLLNKYVNDKRFFYSY